METVGRLLLWWAGGGGGVGVLRGPPSLAFLRVRTVSVSCRGEKDEEYNGLSKSVIARFGIPHAAKVYLL